VSFSVSHQCLNRLDFSVTPTNLIWIAILLKKNLVINDYYYYVVR